MNDIQLHHLFNHLAPIGVMIGLIVLIVGIIIRKGHLKITAAWIILIAGISVFPANRTGEMAEEKSEQISGVSHKVIHEHEEAAELALKLTLICALIALAYIIAEKKFPQWKNAIQWLMLASALASVITLTIAAHEGGLIRHPELGQQKVSNLQNGNQENEEDHDD